jgi:hypothetical protein
MPIKIFEVRDRATMIPVIAVKVFAANYQERMLMSRAGYGFTEQEQGEYTLVGNLEGANFPAVFDPYDQGIREMKEAHMYINEHWDDLDHGAVIDLEMIRTTNKGKGE